ncbi:hypothetical protein C8Q77DRAFT_496779 [Trametes polyzona]|nr:hypothetical protein C8Q77DRAFT_496779 [Trametes polyzona]
MTRRGVMAAHQPTPCMHSCRRLRERSCGNPGKMTTAHGRLSLSGRCFNVWIYSASCHMSRRPRQASHSLALSATGSATSLAQDTGPRTVRSYRPSRWTTQTNSRCRTMHPQAAAPQFNEILLAGLRRCSGVCLLPLALVVVCHLMLVAAVAPSVESLQQNDWQRADGHGPCSPNVICLGIQTSLAACREALLCTVPYDSSGPSGTHLLVG